MAAAPTGQAIDPAGAADVGVQRRDVDTGTTGVGVGDAQPCGAQQQAPGITLRTTRHVDAAACLHLQRPFGRSEFDATAVAVERLSRREQRGSRAQCQCAIRCQCDAATVGAARVQRAAHRQGTTVGGELDLAR